MSALIQFSKNLPTINQVTRLLVDEAMKRAKGNKAVAARLLNISGQQLDRHLRKKNIIKHSFLNCLASLFIMFTSISAHGNEANHAKGQVIVKFKPHATQKAITQLIDDYDMTISEKIPQIGYYVLNLPNSYTVDEIVSSWSRQDIVQTCESNDLTTVQSLPNDEYFPDQWGLRNDGSRSGIENADLAMEEAWEIESGDPNVIIAVIDMGFDLNHEDLQENIWQNPGEIPANGIDDDTNGYIDDVVGWDFVNQPDGLEGNDYDWNTEDNDPSSERSSHGNSILGIIGASANNSIGIAGIAGHCKIMLIRAGYFKPDGSQSLSSVYIIKGIIYAADNGARVINISSGSSRYNQSYVDALQYAINKGALITCSAGNSATDELIYPAAYDMPGLISVGSSTRKDTKCRFSNYGDWVDVSAPGDYIMTTLLNDRYGKVSGTSFSSPMVTAVAALIFSKYPDMSPANVQDTIMNNVDISEDLSEANITSGRVNAYKALQNPTTENRWSSIKNASAIGADDDGGDDFLDSCFVSTIGL